MALVKFLKGTENALPSTKTEGQVYITTDTHEMYVDIKLNNELKRIKIGNTVVQSDWNENNTDSLAYILNKPDLSNYITSTDLTTVLNNYCTAEDCETNKTSLEVKITALLARIAALEPPKAIVELEIDGTQYKTHIGTDYIPPKDFQVRLLNSEDTPISNWINLSDDTNDDGLTFLSANKYYTNPALQIPLLSDYSLGDIAQIEIQRSTYEQTGFGTVNVKNISPSITDNTFYTVTFYAL